MKTHSFSLINRTKNSPKLSNTLNLQNKNEYTKISDKKNFREIMHNMNIQPSHTTRTLDPRVMKFTYL